MYDVHMIFITHIACINTTHTPTKSNPTQPNQARLKELDAATETRNEARKRHDDLRRQRLEDFMAGTRFCVWGFGCGVLGGLWW